jgi:UDP-N-acetylglucosamine--N-acetylmuramyl-(pentapeptide) pyrophosphoryl-undecaprenol N-acetylglucosamine transferase
MKIMFSGGGTLGPVTTLLAIAEAIREKAPTSEFVWVGTKHGVEKPVVEKAGIKFITIISGKLRRYISIQNFFDLFKIKVGFFQSLRILSQERPNLLISAGGFVSVPLHWAAWFLKIPTWIHQQDVLPGLANKLMARTATKITVALEDSLKYFDSAKTQWLGNPCRNVSADRNESKRFFQISDDKLVLLAVGGGTGAGRLNQMMLEMLPKLDATCHVIHLTGPERDAKLNFDAQNQYPNYRVYSFLNHEMIYALNAADIVFSRAGFATLTELSALSKAVILMPIPHTQQEQNVTPLVKAGAVYSVDEISDTGAIVAKRIRELAEDSVKRDAIGRALHASLPIATHEKIFQVVSELIKK